MSVPFALSIHNFVDKIGAYCGFAAIIGLAILILLLFAHAREIANLRRTLGEAQERIMALEGRIVQLLRAPVPQRGPAQPAQPPVTPAPGRAAMGSTAASFRRPAPAPPAEEAPPAPFAPPGLGAPARASAPRLVGTAAAGSRRVAQPRRGIEVPAAAPAAVPSTAAAVAGEDTVLVPAAAAAATAAAAAPSPAGNGRGRAAAAAPPPTRTRPPAPPARGGGGGAGSRALPPRVQMRDGQPVAPAGRRGQAPPSLQEPPTSRSARRRILSGLAGLVVVAAIIVALLVVTKNGGTTKSNVTHPGRGASTHNAGSKGSAGKGKKHKSPAVKPSDVTVAVLNGTAVSGLAQDVSDVLSKHGYGAGPVTNAAVQTQSSTVVAYRGNKVRYAQAVAKSLGLPSRAVERADETMIQSCETPATGTTTNSSSCGANVIVTVGEDKSSLASSGTTTSA